jgi:hypothetical protein
VLARNLCTTDRQSDHVADLARIHMCAGVSAMVPQQIDGPFVFATKR